MKRLLLVLAVASAPLAVHAQPAPQPQHKDYPQIQVGNMLMESIGREANTGAALLAAQDKIAELEGQIKAMRTEAPKAVPAPAEAPK